MDNQQEVLYKLGELMGKMEGFENRLSDHQTQSAKQIGELKGMIEAIGIAQDSRIAQHNERIRELENAKNKIIAVGAGAGFIIVIVWEVVRTVIKL